MNKTQLKENATVLALFFVSVHLLYFKTINAGFVTDFTGLQQRLEGAPFSDFLTCFGFPAMHQVTNFFLYIFYKLFEANPLPWYLVFTSLHIINGFLGYRLAKKILPKGIMLSFLFGISLPALVAAFLFIVNPYNAEAVVWKVCFNFLFSTLTLLSALLLLIKYQERRKRADLIGSQALFLVALFTFELALSFPIMAGLLVFWWHRSKGRRPFTIKSLVPVSVPHILLVGLYFVLNKLVLGGWVGHYGESVHLNFQVKTIAANCLKYFSKYFLFWRDWKHPAKQFWISFADQPTAAYGAAMVGLLLFFTGLFFYKRIYQKWQPVWLGWSLFFVALAPVSNLFVAWVLHSENDRYGYFASLFFFIGMVALFQYFEKGIRLGLYVILISVSISFLNELNNYWADSDKVVRHLLAEFEWEEEPEIYILAFPENFKGVPMFKDFSHQDLALKHALKYSAGKKTSGKFHQVAQYNMNTPEDGLTGSFLKKDSIKLEFREWGNWWWRNGVGTGGYETPQYNFKTLPKGSEIKLKNTAKDAVFIYSDGDEWVELNPG